LDSNSSTHSDWKIVNVRNQNDYVVTEENNNFVVVKANDCNE